MAVSCPNDEWHAPHASPQLTHEGVSLNSTSKRFSSSSVSAYRTMIRLAICVAALGCVSLGVGAQIPPQPPPQIPIGDAVIDGSVTAAATKRAVAGATVTVSGDVVVGGRSIPLARTTVTDNAGRFSFARLPSGRFTVSVRRDPFLLTRYGQTRPSGPGTPVVVAAAEHRSLAIELVQGGSISGQVLDENGAPLQGVRVVASRWAYENGVRSLVGSPATATSDDGSYRVSGLVPGEWVIAVHPPANAASLARQAHIEALIAAAPRRPPEQVITIPVEVVAGYLPVYFPGVGGRGSAATITLGPGDQRSGVDLQARFPRAAVIRGTVGVPGGPEFRVFVGAQSNEAGGGFWTNGSATFAFPNLPPGRYTIGVEVAPMSTLDSLNRQGGIPPDDLAHRYWGSTDVDLAGPEANIAVALRPANTVSGRASYETKFSEAPAISLRLVPGARYTIFGAPTAHPGPDGSFSLAGVFPGRYQLQLSGGVAKSAMVNGVDALDFGLAVAGEDIADLALTITDRLSSVAGILAAPSGAPVSDCTIVIAPADSRYWVPGARRIQITRPGVDGQYVFNNLPAGDYILSALTDIEPGQQFDPEFLNDLSAVAVRVHVGDRAAVTQHLRLGR